MSKNMTVSSNGKKVLKILHILLAGSIMGGLISVLSILILKSTGRFDVDTFQADFIILTIFKWLVSYSFLGLLATTFIYGLFTEWGFVKYRWIITKWVLVSGMFAIVWFGLGPAINGLTSISDAGLSQGIMSAQYSSFNDKALVYSIAEVILTIIVAGVSVLKPWGIRNVKKCMNQRVVIMVLLPVILVIMGFTAFNIIKLNKIRSMPIKNVDLKKIENRTYDGQAKVGSYVYKVKVEVKDNKIISIVALDNRKSPYVTYAEGVFKKIIKQQKIDVDAVTGATTTSKAFMKAVENALQR